MPHPRIGRSLLALVSLSSLLALQVIALPGAARAAGANPNEQVTTGFTPVQLAQSLVGAGVTVSAVTFTGATGAIGSFSFTDPAVVGFSQGLVMSSGNVADVVGPNTSDSMSTDWGLPGDTSLDALATFPTQDAAVLEFDFTPVTNQVVFNYAFASDEYPEWVNTPYNDTFAFFVNGSNCAQVRQVAGDPTAAFVPVGVNNINNSNPVQTPMPTPMRPDLFRANYFNPAGPSAIDLEQDGITQVLTCQSAVNPGVANHMKLAIADASDGIYDSAVFIQAGSIVSNDSPTADLSLYPDAGPAPLDLTATVEGHDPNAAALTYSIAWGDGTADTTGALPGETTLAHHTYTAAGQYHPVLTVSNGTLAGTSTEDVQVSGPATPAPPVVTTQPVSLLVNPGDVVTFSAAASGVPAPTVQWQSSTGAGATWADIPGATDAILSFNAQVADNGTQYHAVFTNGSGEAVSNPATLSVNTTPGDLPPVVVTNPEDLTVNDGATATFTAAASGVPAPDVQWWVSSDGGDSWSVVPGATDPTLSFTASASDNQNQYEAVFTNAVGSATSDAATLRVNSPPQVTQQPQSLTVNAGDQVTFSAAASGQPAPAMQWQESTNGGVSWANLIGETAGTLSFSAQAIDNADQYRAYFSNPAGNAFSDAAVLTVNSPPEVTGQPLSLTLNAGATASFSASASGQPAPTVHWQVLGAGAGATWSEIPGATSAVLSFTAQSSDNASQYRAVFTNALGTATSDAATLTVNVAPVVTSQPASVTLITGATATFWASASGRPTPGVHWQVLATGAGATWTDIPGATGATLTVATIADMGGWQYRAVFTNSVGTAVSNPATLTLTYQYLGAKSLKADSRWPRGGAVPVAFSPADLNGQPLPATVAAALPVQVQLWSTAAGGSALASAPCTYTIAKHQDQYQCSLALPATLVKGATYWIAVQDQVGGGAYVTAPAASTSVTPNPIPIRIR